MFISTLAELSNVIADIGITHVRKLIEESKTFISIDSNRDGSHKLMHAQSRTHLQGYVGVVNRVIRQENDHLIAVA